MLDLGSLSLKGGALHHCITANDLKCTTKFPAANANMAQWITFWEKYPEGPAANVQKEYADEKKKHAPSRAETFFLHKGGVCQHWSAAFIALYKFMNLEDAPVAEMVKAGTHAPHAFVRFKQGHRCTFHDPLSARLDGIRDEVSFKSHKGLLDTAKGNHWKDMYEIKIKHPSLEHDPCGELPRAERVNVWQASSV